MSKFKANYKEIGLVEFDVDADWIVGSKKITIDDVTFILNEKTNIYNQESPTNNYKPSNKEITLIKNENK